VPYYLTTPIYYVNARPHLGHAYTTIAADVAARHMRQRGEDVFFLTGTDEHGDKIAREARARGVDPKAHADELSEAFRALTHDLQATNDFFIRTTDPEHERFVQDFWQQLKDAGDVYEGLYAGLYCTSCEAFYTEAELVDGRCPIHDTVPEWLEERNWFFRLSAYAERLLAHFDAQPDFVVPRTRMNEARAFVEGGLDDISISRSSITWGVPLPWQPEQVLYVWIDALLNYASALTYADGRSDLAAFWPPRWQLLGKDILKFHAVIWPAMLLAAGRELPRQLLIHGYLTVRDAKMSKTTGNVLDPTAVIERYGVDALRYYVLREVRFGGDGNVSYAGVHERYHAELANDLGNLVSRTAAMVARYRGGQVPDGRVDATIADALDEAARRFAGHVDRFELTEAIEAAWAPVRDLNRFVEERAPWQLAKDGARAAELDDVLYTLVDGIRVVAVILAAVTPAAATRILRVVGAGEHVAWEQARSGLTTAGVTVGADGPLFPRVDEQLDA
jgi:methionyl-tRNA synthetase